jgi:RHS repeat-associated protein
MTAYEPYGSHIQSSRSSNPESLRHTFTDQEFGDEIGLFYFGARYYDPISSLFLSPDPLPPRYGVSSQDYNRYAYARNNPLAFIDPDGRAPELPPGQYLTPVINPNALDPRQPTISSGAGPLRPMTPVDPQVWLWYHMNLGGGLAAEVAMAAMNPWGFVAELLITTAFKSVLSYDPGFDRRLAESLPFDPFSTAIEFENGDHDYIIDLELNSDEELRYEMTYEGDRVYVKEGGSYVADFDAPDFQWRNGVEEKDIWDSLGEMQNVEPPWDFLPSDSLDDNYGGGTDDWDDDDWGYFDDE